MNDYSVGILYICTGKYDVFWREFYETCEHFFLGNNRKEYFVFTDAEKISYESNQNVHKVFQRNLGWPDNTLMRFHMFTSVENSIQHLDYLFFFNANLMFVTPIGAEILPMKENLVVVRHPGYRNASRDSYPYERNPQSLAYIAKEEGCVYVQGALIGGKSSAFLEMSKLLRNNINQDKQNGIVAVWHDESHLNRYIVNRTDYKLLGPEYVNQEGVDYGCPAKILSRNKDKYLDIDQLRGIKLTVYQRIKKFVKKIFGRY